MLLHAAVLGVAIYFSYAAATEQAKKAPKILELVAGTGGDFRATAAPLLGTPGGVKVDIPKTTPVTAEPPRPEPPKPVVPKAEPAPVAPPPAKAPAPNATKPPPQRTFLQQIKRQMVIGEVTAKRQVQKERDAEQKRITKEEFDKAQRAKVAAAKTNQKFEKISTEGITGGVVGGSKNSKAGAGGNALTADEQDDAARYGAYLNQLLTDELGQVTGLTEGLTCEASFEVMGNGRLSHPKIVRSSHNERFDSAVLHAIAAVRMPEGPPKGFDRLQSVTFHSQAKN